MFLKCTSLSTAPIVLPATTLAGQCYSGMFEGCEHLTTAPELPAERVFNKSYFEMFKECSNLNYIKCLATDINADKCTQDWVNGVSSTGTFDKHPNMTENDWSRGTSGIPSGWDVEEAVL
jgi:hypothetical protein